MIKFSNIEINFQFNFLLLCYNMEVYIMMLSLLYILKSNNYYLLKLIIFSYKHREKWGLGIGDWGLANPQSPIPNPQSPIYFIIYEY